MFSIWAVGQSSQVKDMCARTRPGRGGSFIRCKGGRRIDSGLLGLPCVIISAGLLGNEGYLSGHGGVFLLWFGLSPPTAAWVLGRETGRSWEVTAGGVFRASVSRGVAEGTYRKRMMPVLAMA